MLGFVQIIYVPGMLPIVSKDFRKAFLREMISQTSAVVSVGVLWYGGGVIFSADLGICCMLCCC